LAAHYVAEVFSLHLFEDFCQYAFLGQEHDFLSIVDGIGDVYILRAAGFSWSILINVLNSLKDVIVFFPFNCLGIVRDHPVHDFCR
jgi:hypothetical protein